MKLRVLFLALLIANLSAVSAHETFQYPAKARAKANQHAAFPKTLKVQPGKLPAEIVLILKVEELPGISNPKSFWEGAYEIRVGDWGEIVDKTTSESGQPIGEMLLSSSFSKRSFIAKSNREVRVSIPVAGQLLERLQQQTQRPQGFVLRSTIRLFDAQLKLTRAFDLNRVWQAKLFPDGEATIALGLKPDGSYNTWGPIPRDLPPGYTIVGAPRKSGAGKP